MSTVITARGRLPRTARPRSSSARICGSTFQLSGVLSRRTGRAPRYITAFAVAANVNDGTSTVSPRRTPAAISARCSAAVPLLSATACRTPTSSAHLASNASRSGPTGATQFESNASSSSFRSTSVTSGGDR